MQGELTLEEAKNVRAALDEMFDAIPKSKRLQYLGCLNDVLLFVSAIEVQISSSEVEIEVQISSSENEKAE